METNSIYNANPVHRHRTVKQCIELYKKEYDKDSSITEYLLRQLIHRKKVKSIFMGGKNHVDFDDLLRYLSSTEEEVA